MLKGAYFSVGQTLAHLWCTQLILIEWCFALIFDQGQDIFILVKPIKLFKYNLIDIMLFFTNLTMLNCWINVLNIDNYFCCKIF